VVPEEFPIGPKNNNNKIYVCSRTARVMNVSWTNFVAQHQDYHNWKWSDDILCQVCRPAIMLFIHQDTNASFRHNEKTTTKDKAMENGNFSSDIIMNARGLG